MWFPPLRPAASLWAGSVSMGSTKKVESIQGKLHVYAHCAHFPERCSDLGTLLALTQVREDQRGLTSRLLVSMGHPGAVCCPQILAHTHLYKCQPVSIVLNKKLKRVRCGDACLL